MKAFDIAVKPFFNIFSKRFIAGETIDQAIKKAVELKKHGIGAVFNILGEHIKDINGVDRFVARYGDLIQKIKENNLDANIAVKPSQIGLDISSDIFVLKLQTIFETAKKFGVIVESDREAPEYLRATHETFINSSRKGFAKNLRVCCQSKMARTAFDICDFSGVGISVRLCMGADAYNGDYGDSEKIAEIYRKQAEWLLLYGIKPIFATHNLKMVKNIIEIANDKKITQDKFEFHFLLGIENGFAKKLAKEGYKVKLYLPFGSKEDRFLYCKRRWKSVPKIFWRNYWQGVEFNFTEPVTPFD